MPCYGDALVCSQLRDITDKYRVKGAWSFMVVVVLVGCLCWWVVVVLVVFVMLIVCGHAYEGVYIYMRMRLLATHTRNSE